MATRSVPQRAGAVHRDDEPGFGLSTIEATGEVYNLRDLAQFPDTYGQARYGFGDRFGEGGDPWDSAAVDSVDSAAAAGKAGERIGNFAQFLAVCIRLKRACTSTSRLRKGSPLCTP